MILSYTVCIPFSFSGCINILTQTIIQFIFIYIGNYYLQDMRVVNKIFNTITQRNIFNKVETKNEEKIGYIYLNSPKDLNCLHQEARATIAQSVRAFDASKDVKVILIMSNVAKAFCAGANIKEFQNKTSQDFENNDIFKDLHDSLYEAKKPIVSAVNGVALGGGFELALLTDVIFCSEQARFALPELKLGLIPGIGGTQRFARIAGKVNASRYIFSSEFFTAQKAYQMGIVSDIFSTVELHQKVIEYARQITNRPLSAILAAKKALKQNENLSMREGVALERKVFYPLFNTPGFKEGVNAFVSKKTPNHYDL